MAVVVEFLTPPVIVVVKTIAKLVTIVTKVVAELMTAVGKVLAGPVSVTVEDNAELVTPVGVPRGTGECRSRGHREAGDGRSRGRRGAVEDPVDYNRLLVVELHLPHV